MNKSTHGSTKISVLVPSRSRVNLLKESIKNKKPETEVLVWVDSDDPQVNEYLKLEDAKVYVMPPIGYDQFHQMINFLSEQATGDWLMLWNDDALILTENWEDKIPEALDKPEVLNFFDPMGRTNNLFPIISRKMYEIMGHYSLSAHCDSWVQDIANELDIHIPVIGIEARHLRESIYDETKAKSQSVYARTSPMHYSTLMQELMIRDIQRLQEALGS